MIKIEFIGDKITLTEENKSWVLNAKDFNINFHKDHFEINYNQNGLRWCDKYPVTITTNGFENVYDADSDFSIVTNQLISTSPKYKGIDNWSEAKGKKIYINPLLADSEGETFDTNGLFKGYSGGLLDVEVLDNYVSLDSVLGSDYEPVALNSDANIVFTLPNIAFQNVINPVEGANLNLKLKGSVNGNLIPIAGGCDYTLDIRNLNTEGVDEFYLINTNNISIRENKYTVELIGEIPVCESINLNNLKWDTDYDFNVKDGMLKVNFDYSEAPNININFNNNIAYLNFSNTTATNIRSTGNIKELSLKFKGAKINRVYMSGIVNTYYGDFSSCFEDSTVSSITFPTDKTSIDDLTKGYCDNIYKNCTNLTQTINVPLRSNINSLYFTDFNSCFENCTKLYNIELYGLNQQQYNKLKVENNTPIVGTFNRTFANCSNATAISLYRAYYDEVVFNEAFVGCNKVTRFSLPNIYAEDSSYVKALMNAIKTDLGGNWRFIKGSQMSSSRIVKA